VLHDKYLFPEQDANALSAFLSPMLRLHPDKRAKASDLVHHNWLEAVLVQGEIDVIRRLEMDEAVKRRGLLEERERQQEQQEEEDEAERSSKERRLLDQSERDAMKPVDESMTSVNGVDEDDDEEEEEEEEEEDEDEEGGGGSRKRLKHHQAPILGAPPIPTMASGIARALQQSNANANANNPSSATTNNRTPGSASAGSKRRT